MYDYQQIQRIQKKKTGPIVQEVSENSSENDNDLTTLADKINNGHVDTRELIFIQSQANIIEKNLGEGEIMRIRPECLVAFSPTVLLKKHTAPDFMWLGGLIQFNGISQRSKFIGVKGPGLVYIDMKQSKTFFKKDQLSLYVIILYGLLYFIMFMVILLDRRDPIPINAPLMNQMGERPGAVDIVNDLAQQLMPGVNNGVN